jgi:hypothetical protein
MTIEHELACVFDRYEALLTRNLANERLRIRRLAGARRSRDQNVLAAGNSESHEAVVLLCLQEGHKFHFR